MTGVVYAFCFTDCSIKLCRSYLMKSVKFVCKRTERFFMILNLLLSLLHRRNNGCHGMLISVRRPSLY